MNKYWTLFLCSWQKQMEARSDFIFERARSLSLLVSLYFLWSAILSNRGQVAGYERAEILTYVIGTTFLRALVLACVSDRIPMEIAKGHLSDLLLRPISPLWFWVSQDAASKALNIISSIIELSIFFVLLHPPLMGPQGVAQFGLFVVSTIGAMILYFQMSYLLGVVGFWTAQSWGPRFCFEVILEFCAGAYFPIDVLPKTMQLVLSLLPFPYLIFQPMSIYLGRLSVIEITHGLMVQVIWIFIFSFGIRVAWEKGLQVYGAEGR